MFYLDDFGIVYKSANLGTPNLHFAGTDHSLSCEIPSRVLLPPSIAPPKPDGGYHQAASYLIGKP
jgi:hypothetical protein